MNTTIAENLTAEQAVFFIQNTAGYIDTNEKNPKRYKITTEFPPETPIETLSQDACKLKVKKHLANLVSKISSSIGIKLLIVDGFTGSIFLKSYNKNELNNAINTLLDWSKSLEIKTSWKECITPPVWNTELTFNFYHLLGN